MGKLILHGLKLSPFVRSTFAVAAATGVDMEYKYVDLLKLENHTPEFLEMNPLHTVPVLDDDGKYIIDSHAILCYLVDQYDKDESLYPKDPYKRAMVNQRLHFDSGILYMTLKNVLVRSLLDFFVKNAVICGITDACIHRGSPQVPSKRYRCSPQGLRLYGEVLK